MTAKNYLCKILKQEAFILGGVSVLIAVVTWLASSWRDYHIFKSCVIKDIAELKIITKETKIAVETGNKENLQRDIDLKLWMTRLDQKMNDKHSHPPSTVYGEASRATGKNDQLSLGKENLKNHFEAFFSPKEAMRWRNPAPLSIGNHFHHREKNNSCSLVTFVDKKNG